MVSFSFSDRFVWFLFLFCFTFLSNSLPIYAAASLIGPADFILFFAHCGDSPRRFFGACPALLYILIVVILYWISLDRGKSNSCSGLLVFLCRLTALTGRGAASCLRTRHGGAGQAAVARAAGCLVQTQLGSLACLGRASFLSRLPR